MKLVQIRGHIASYGQHQMLPAGYRYAWLEFVEESGQRLTINDVWASTNDPLILDEDGDEAARIRRGQAIEI
ncbi:hypothetical protein HNR60_002815 [Rhodopseudomonas rhenobacensis]|uniref:Uncharacterized protein n=1 Tax=Rhodopseudomonas rhenobacensis TaxID=87461 RepID=A0A7W7Z4Y0_9BRAD|nr:hypothetical protein [Rhodopseudomonas rhenobacensis]MBB5048054.1 hypothetical protein [Rhodopseudomonas rhenobacensis]